MTRLGPRDGLAPVEISRGQLEFLATIFRHAIELQPDGDELSVFLVRHRSWWKRLERDAPDLLGAIKDATRKKREALGLPPYKPASLPRDRAA